MEEVSWAQACINTAETTSHAQGRNSSLPHIWAMRTNSLCYRGYGISAISTVWLL